MLLDLGGLLCFLLLFDVFVALIVSGLLFFGFDLVLLFCLQLLVSWFVAFRLFGLLSLFTCRFSCVCFDDLYVFT